MGTHNTWAGPVAAILILLLASCSGGGGSGSDSASGESVYDAGSSIDALSFANSSKVELYFVDQDGGSTLVQDGDYLEAGAKKFAVKVWGDPTTVDRVFVSDGGVFQVEAFLKDGRYEFEYPVSNGNLYQIMLIQVIHHSGKASKEKIVLRTARSYRDMGYIKNGMGILLSHDILDDQREGLADVLEEKITLLFSKVASENPSLVTSLSCGDGNSITRDVVINSLEAVSSDTYPAASVHMNFTIKQVSFSGLPLFGQDFISTQHNDLTIDTYVGIRDVNSRGEVRFILDPMGSAQAVFSNQFFFQGVLQDKIASGLGSIDMPPISLNLRDKAQQLKDALPTHFTINSKDVDVSTLLSGLGNGLERYLFIDAYGDTDDSLQGVLALGLGLCVEDAGDIVWGTTPAGGASGQLSMEKVFTDLLQSATDSMFQTIKQENSGLVTELSYGDGNPATPDVLINSLVLGSTGNANIKTAQADFTVRMVDLEAVSLFGLSFISTSDNDLDIKATFNVEYRETGSVKQVVITTRSVSSVAFSKWFLGKLSVEEMIKQDLLGMGEKSFDLNEILSGFQLGVDMSGAFSNQGTYPVFPDLVAYNQIPGWDLGVLSTYNFRLALSQNCINWLLEDTMSQVSEWDVKEVLIPILGGSFSGFESEGSPDEATILSLSVPPVLDLRNGKIRLIVPDAVIQYRVSGVPQWEASIDLDLIITPIVEGSGLNFYVTPTVGQNHFHIMKDNRGNLGVFDHSSLVEKTISHLPEMLGQPAGGPVLAVDLNSLGTSIVYKNVSNPIRVLANGGYLYVDIAASYMDLMKYVDLLGQ